MLGEGYKQVSKGKGLRDLNSPSKGLSSGHVWCDPDSARRVVGPERSEQEEWGEMRQEAVLEDAAYIGPCLQMKGLYLFLCWSRSH